MRILDFPSICPALPGLLFSQNSRLPSRTVVL